MCFVLTGAEVEDSIVPEAVPVEGVVPEAEVATEAATEPTEMAAPGVTEEGHGDALPEVNLEVVVRSPEIQDAEPIHSAPMSEAATTSRVDSSFWRMISSARQRCLATWSRCGMPSNG
jgi:hypothetical protein